MLTGSVLEQQAVVGLAGGAPPRAMLAGVATARRGRAKTANEARRENMLICLREKLNDC